MSDTYKKPEKLASAIYLVTSFFSDQEPLKWRMRNLASDLVSLTSIFKDSFYSDRKQAALESRSVIQELASLLEVAKNAGLVSDMNHSIIHKELMNYMDNLELPTGISTDHGRAVLSSSFFAPSDPELKSPEQSVLERLEDKKAAGNLEPEIVQKSNELLPSIKGQNFADRPVQSAQNRPAKERDLKEFGAVSVKKNSRQSIIISLLKRKKEIMIKDVSPLIDGCSEKTIQRELLAMVQSGILKKTGEKRWSRYSLARE